MKWALLSGIFLEVYLWLWPGARTFAQLSAREYVRANTDMNTDANSDANMDVNMDVRTDVNMDVRSKECT